MSQPTEMDPKTRAALEALDAIHGHALKLPGAWEDFPWGERVAKVGKKVFAFLGKGELREDGSFGLSVKLPESGPDVLTRPNAEPTGYNLGKSGWVSLTFSRDALPDVAEVKTLIEESFRAVAPKKYVRLLDAEKNVGLR